MVTATQILLLLHLIGFASLFGGLLVQLRSADPEVNAAMLYGAYIQLVTGLLLAVGAEIRPGAAGLEANHVKLGVKLLISLIITLLVTINRRFSSIPRGLWALIGVLTLGNAAIAVLWH